MKLSSYVVAFLFILNSSVFAQSNKKMNPIEKYLVREPKIKSTHPPLILLLHGVGSNEEDLFSFANELPDRFLVVSARAPHTLGQGSYAWFNVNFGSGAPVINPEQAENSRLAILSFLEQLQKEHPYDPANVYLVGFSQGGIMSYSVGLTHPDKIKGIAVMSGRLLLEVRPKIATDEQLKPLNIFISHGTNDPVLPVHYAQEAKAYLNSKGLQPTYKEYPAVHTITREMLDDLVRWLSVDR